MTLTAGDWHSRFSQQSAWTRPLRQYLLPRMGLTASSRILEAGCGTGAITADLHQDTPASVFGLDLNLAFLHLAHQHEPATTHTGGDALRLPFSDGAFDAVVCHFFLLWIPQPGGALAEMRRVVRPGGAVAAFAEPDYAGRIDYPQALAELGRLQAAALRRQGAEPDTGRRLSGLFHAAGLREVETGLMGGQWRGRPSPAEIDSEWAILEADLEGQVSPDRLRELRRIDEDAWSSGERVLFVPTFYAIGFK
jgi:SAM-dependent methyltransferase